MFKVKKDHSDSMSLSKRQATHGNSLRETDKCRQLGEDEWPGSTTRSSENSSATDSSATLVYLGRMIYWQTGPLEPLRLCQNLRLRAGKFIWQNMERQNPDEENTLEWF